MELQWDLSLYGVFGDKINQASEQILRFRVD